MSFLASCSLRFLAISATFRNDDSIDDSPDAWWAIAVSPIERFVWPPPLRAVSPMMGANLSPMF